MSRSQDPNPDSLAFQEALAGRYSLVRELGRGGMGIVYLARDVALDREIALKLLPPAYGVQPLLRERFIREARTAAKLSHPNIVPIHTVEEVDDYVFFVMSFVEGQTLGERIRERGPVAPREASRILREVSWALAYAHAQGVVHRDIKPDNILLELGTGRALVTDFGIAHAGEAAGLTTVGEVLGTPEYMSPEQASGEEVDARSDIYALGIVGHYMLSGELPFQGSSAQATLAKQLTQAPPALHSVAPEVPGSLAAALDQCLAKAPDERVQGGEELADLLDRVLRDRKEIPSAIRVFVEQHRESAIVIPPIVLLVLMTIVSLGFLRAGEADLVELVLMIGGTAAWTLAPLGMLGFMARRLLEAGYGYEDMLLGFRRDVDDRRRALASEVGVGHSALDVWAPRAAVGGAVVGSLGILSIISPLVPVGVIQAMLLGGLFFGLGGGLIAAARHSLRKAVQGERWLKFWETPIGRGLFKLGGLGLGARRGTVEGSLRPTEMVIGMAAERVFGELPKEVRDSLGDLPAVVGALESHAQEMRARIRELDRVLAEADEPRSSRSQGASGRAVEIQDRRDAVTEEVQATRAAATDRLREVVAALEGLRLELLRLHSGSGTVESLTADLSAARALSADVGLLVEGHQEIDEILGILTDPSELDTPVPG